MACFVFFFFFTYLTPRQAPISFTVLLPSLSPLNFSIILYYDKKPLGSPQVLRQSRNEEAGIEIQNLFDIHWLPRM